MTHRISAYIAPSTWWITRLCTCVY